MKRFKKRFLLLSLCVCISVLAFGLVGCGTNTEKLVWENMAEWTSNYYFAECEQFYVNLAIGEREENYMMNGKSEKKVPFALLSFKPTSSINSKKVVVKLTIDSTVKSVALELNELNGLYMTDLGIEMTGEEEVSVAFENTSITLENVSKNFAVDAEAAVKLACNEIGELILKNRTGKLLNAECYLRVLDKKLNSLDGFFWIFTVVNTSSEDYSVIISAADGKILTSSKQTPDSTQG